jgi:hypothetical protein
VKRPAMVSETIALNATEEAILMRQIMAVRMAQVRTAFRGRADRGLTWLDGD